MNISEAVRRAVLAAIGTVVIDGVSHVLIGGVYIPIFEDFVNPNTTIPIIKGAKTYILIQDQQESEGQQNYCVYRQEANYTIKVVTVYNTGGVAFKKPCEDIGEYVRTKIKPTGKSHALVDANGYSFQKTVLITGRTIPEFAGGTTAFSKVLIFNTTVNQ